MGCSDGAEGLACLCDTGLRHGEQCETEPQCGDNMGCTDGAEGLVCTCVSGLLNKRDGTCGKYAG